MMRVAVDQDLFELVEPAQAGSPVRLLASYSKAADEYFWPRRRRCPLTGAAVDDVLLEARGILWAWTYVHLPWPGSIPFGNADGYGAGLVDLPEGPRIPCLLIGTPSDWTIGTPMVGEAIDLGEEDGVMTCLPGFRARWTG